MLRLLHTPASPFARKVRLAALERGVALTLEIAPVNPVKRNSDLASRNPLAKIPTLLTSQGALYDSRVICRYLDRQGSGPSIYTSELADPWDILTLEALADGIMEAAVNVRYELVNRPEELRWPEWIDAQFARIMAATDHLESHHVSKLKAPHIGAYAVAAALEYLDFRHSARPWRAGRPKLTAWLAKFASCGPMQQTSYPLA